MRKIRRWWHIRWTVMLQNKIRSLELKGYLELNWFFFLCKLNGFVMIAFVDSLLFLISLDLYLFMVWCQSVNACFPFSKLFFSWHFRCWDAFSFFLCEFSPIVK